jgi:tetratricopeptide (TPR) repeat protein
LHAGRSVARGDEYALHRPRGLGRAQVAVERGGRLDPELADFVRAQHLPVLRDEAHLHAGHGPADGVRHVVGVLYLLGYASESLGQMDEALKYYERVFAQDIQ